MTRSGRRRRAHVLEHVPAPGRYPEGGQIPEINTFLGATTKDIHGVIDKRCGMALARNGYVADAIKFRP